MASSIDLYKVCSKAKLNYFLIRGIMMSLVDNRYVNQSILQMSDDNAKLYFEFVKEYFAALCERMGLNSTGEVELGVEEKKERHDLRVKRRTYFLRLNNE